jgi:hypothetical protein
MWLRFASLILIASTGRVSADVVSYPVSSFETPKGPIAFLGCIYFYQAIFQKNSEETYDPIVDMTEEAETPTAVAEAAEAILNTAKTYNMLLEPIDLPYDYKVWVVKQVEKKQIDPTFLAKLCGTRPYALIATVDRYGSFPFEVQMRSEEDGKPIGYFGTPGVLEYDRKHRYKSVYKKVAAMSFYLFSAKDGKLLWQANAVACTEKAFSGNIKHAAAKCAELLIQRFFKLN